MTTVGFLPWWPANPYQVLLKQELNRLGLRVIGNPPLNPLRILFRQDGLDIVHVHWPHGTYKSWGRFFYMVLVLVLYRVIKNNIVWTVHELDAYESRHPRRDAWFRLLVMKLSRCLIVHGEHTRHELVQKYGYRRAIITARHPSYIGWYRDQTNREEARELLGLPPRSRVFLYFGYIKPYKGVEELIEAFTTISDQNSVLLIAGKPLDDATAKKISHLASNDSRIRFFLRYIADDDVQFYFRAADIVVLPFRNTQTSGSLMLALSFGRAIVAPEIATLPEYVDSTCALLYNASAPHALATALREMNSAEIEAMEASALRHAESTSWHQMARTHDQAYRSITGHTE